MKCVISKELLLNSVQKLNSIINITDTYPITENILFNINHSNPHLISTNLELELIKKINCIKIYTPGKIMVSGKKILQIVRSFPKNSEIKINIQNNMMQIKHQNIFFSLQAINNDNFPMFQQESNMQIYNFQQKTFRNIIYNTHFAMAKQDIRHYLNGMNIKIQKNKIVSITTDGYRMAISMIQYEHNQENISIIIPRKTILELIKILNNADTICKIFIGKKIIQFHIDDYIISSKMIENKFPNYQNLLVNHFDYNISISKNKLKKSLNRSLILTNNKLNGVSINISNGVCTIHAQNENDESIIEKFPVNYYDISIDLTINIYYLLDVISVIETELINFFIQKNNSTIYIKDTQLYHSFYIIMPLIL